MFPEFLFPLYFPVLPKIDENIPVKNIPKQNSPSLIGNMGLKWDKLSHAKKILRENSAKNRHISDNSLVIISLFPTPTKNFSI